MSLRCLRLRTTLLLFSLSLLLVTGLVPGMTQAQANQRCFPETGYCIAGRIYEFWEQHGGLSVFGLPITPQQPQVIEDQTVQVQWFERTRLELHPNNPPPFDVLLGRLGVERLEQTGRNWQTFSASTPQPGCRFFPETGHNICGDILAAWRASGLELDRRPGKNEGENLALFGLPLSEAQTERLSNGQEYVVQWFERARFEVHPENTPPYNVLLGLLGSELRGGQSNPVPVSVVRFDPGACPFGVPGGMRVECGFLTVPEDRSQPTSRTIQLAVAIVRAPSGNPAPDPLVYLSGGPGSPALTSTTAFASGWRSFIGNRDFIVIDQRGTGFSRPALKCPEVYQANGAMLGRLVSRTEKVQNEANALLRCRDRLAQEGVNLAMYNSAASAADLEDLRTTLGYSQWNLIGISYGTRLALTAMRDHPQGIRSVVLDSVYPPQVNLHTEMPANADRALNRLFTGCADNASCNARYPDLERVFYELVDQLNANPATVGVSTSSGWINLVVDGNRLISLTYGMLYKTAVIPQLPGMIYAARNGNYDPLSNLESRRLTGDGDFSHAMYFSVQCGEEIAFTNIDEVNAEMARYPRLSTFFNGIMENTPTVFDLCAAWGVHQPDPVENQPVQSNIPTLLLSGEYDPVTPPQWGWQTSQTLSTSFFYEFPGTGHAVVTRGACPYGMIRSFLNNPTAAPESSCVAALGGPAF